MKKIDDDEEPSIDDLVNNMHVAGGLMAKIKNMIGNNKDEYSSIDKLRKYSKDEMKRNIETVNKLFTKCMNNDKSLLKYFEKKGKYKNNMILFWSQYTDKNVDPKVLEEFNEKALYIIKTRVKMILPNDTPSYLTNTKSDEYMREKYKK